MNVIEQHKEKPDNCVKTPAFGHRSAGQVSLGKKHLGFVKSGREHVAETAKVFVVSVAKNGRLNQGRFYSFDPYVPLARVA